MQDVSWSESGLESETVRKVKTFQTLMLMITAVESQKKYNLMACERGKKNLGNKVGFKETKYLNQIQKQTQTQIQTQQV